ncbi:tRNA lysidine(34) synthetase TilS [Pendulispora rubella]|uniref:tRNA(Ile)-lysidine synthase n=1 Tax=Pendulispora rubella TaxID=2741070 RepID=A0ABZ2LG52_9BACT
MSRPSHPPTLLTIARRTIVDESLLAPGDAVLLAVSGGRDSMALLHVMSLLAKKNAYRLLAFGVDHGLRPEAARELDLAESFSRELGVPFGRASVDVAPGGNLQARARDARYLALEDAAAAFGASVIATAHHADDRAETFLLRLLQGSHAAGLAVLPAKAPAANEGKITRIRPLIRANRESIDAHITRHVIAFANDPSNANPRFARARVRHEVLPLLRTMSPKIIEQLCGLADELAPCSEAANARGHAYPLSRATQLALAELRRTQSGTARIQLPGGLVAMADRTHVWSETAEATLSETASTRPLRRPAPKD